MFAGFAGFDGGLAVPLAATGEGPMGKGKGKGPVEMGATATAPHSLAALANFDPTQSRAAPGWPAGSPGNAVVPGWPAVPAGWGSGAGPSAIGGAVEVAEEPEPLALDVLPSRVSLELAQAVLSTIGGDDGLTAEEFASIPWASVEAVLPSIETEGAPLTPVAIGAVLRWHRDAAARVAALRPAPVLEQQLALPGTPRAGTQQLTLFEAPRLETGLKRKLADYLEQGAKGDFLALTPGEFGLALAVHKRKVEGLPLPGAIPTPEQLGALRHVLALGDVPFADFAVFGPHGRRAAKLRSFQAHVFVEGEWVTRQLVGPANFTHWAACWRMFRSSMLGLDAGIGADFDIYEEGIRILSMLFPNLWGLIFRADETMRSEEWRMIHYGVVGMGAAPGGWPSIIRRSAYGAEDGNRSQWWMHHVLTPALTAPSALGAAALVDRVEGIDSTIGASSGTGGPSARPQGADARAQQQPPPRALQAPVQVAAAGAAATPPGDKRSARAKRAAKHADARAKAGAANELCHSHARWGEAGCKSPCKFGRRHA